MEKSEIKKQYTDLTNNYLRLKDNLEDALRLYLDNKKIPYLAVYGRVKSFDSFYEKIERKNYIDPFSQTEDFVGLRVILYFPSDIGAVIKLIADKFIIEQSEDKSDELEINEFGYRSHHCIVKIDNDWCKTPNYQGLNDIKSEIQVRTVLMHAWAEIEHKLQYKNKEQVPHELQRKLFFLSAKLEEADQQFEEIKDKANQYQKEIAEKLRKEGKFDTEMELNLDTFEQFLSFFYPNNYEHKVMTEDKFNLICKNNLNYTDLVHVATEFQGLEKQLKKEVNPLAQAAVFSYALSVVTPSVTSSINNSKSRNELINKLKAQYKKKV